MTLVLLQGKSRTTDFLDGPAQLFRDAYRLFLRRPSISILALSTLVTWIVGLTHPSTWSLYVVASLWLLFGFYVWYQLFRQGHYWLSALPALLLVVIAVGVSLPRELFDQLMDPFNTWLTSFEFPLPAGKIGHILGFCVLTTVCLALRKRLSIQTFDLYLILALLAAATEGIQLYVAGRTPSLRDFLFDSIGVAIGTIVFLAIQRWRADTTDLSPVVEK